MRKGGTPVAWPDAEDKVGSVNVKGEEGRASALSCVPRIPRGEPGERGGDLRERRVPSAQLVTPGSSVVCSAVRTVSNARGLHWYGS